MDANVLSNHKRWLPIIGIAQLLALNFEHMEQDCYGPNKHFLIENKLYTDYNIKQCSVY